MWALFESGELTPELALTGLFKEDTASADVDTVLEEIKAAFEEEEARIERISDANAVDSDY
jgi:RIO kinase 1